MTNHYSIMCDTDSLQLPKTHIDRSCLTVDVVIPLTMLIIIQSCTQALALSL